ncbi:MAG: hypothetical protein QOE11_11 [Solirubrobacteraceae bacterium]|jgi:hypothetical protein|nr:hypothetical protein [Solirubrobacteraceae bacterium]
MALAGRGSIATGATVVATGLLIALPSFSSGATVKPKLRSFAPATTRQVQAADPTTQPPLHGTNPHGQGTVATVDLNPSATRPFSADPTGSTDSEDVVVGRSRGEQRADGTYHGHITVAALFGNEIIAGADTAPGQQVHSGIAQDLLTNLCNGTGICLGAVHVDSVTNNSGSINHLTVASAAIGNAQLPALRIGAAESDGNIAADANCQASHGASQVLDVLAGGQVAASAATSTSDARACRNQGPTQTNASRVVTLGQNGLPVPAAGCDNGTADVKTGLPALLPIVCNADDSSATGGVQASAPYGVRDALDVYVLAVGQAAAAKLSTSSSESQAVAPAAAPAVVPPANNPGNANNPAAGNANNPAAGNQNANDNAGNAGAGNNGAANNGNGNGNNGNNGNGNGGNGAPQCSDGVDNDGDGVIDRADPGCHTDGNANNAATFNPNDDSEANGAASLSSRGQLPFTGTDVVGLGLAGALLLAAGLALRGPSRRREFGS